MAEGQRASFTAKAQGGDVVDARGVRRRHAGLAVADGVQRLVELKPGAHQRTERSVRREARVEPPRGQGALALRRPHGPSQMTIPKVIHA